LTAQHLQFLLRVTPPALASQFRYEVPACVTIAQAILESATPVGWGSSTLFRLANNPFGIKHTHFEGANCGRGAGEAPSIQPSASSALMPGTRETGRGEEDSKFKIQNSGSRIPNPEPSVPNPRPGLSNPEPSVANPRPGLSNPETLGPNPGSRIPRREATAPNSASPAPRAQHPAPILETYGHFDVAAWEIENAPKKVITAQFQRFLDLDEAFHAHARLLCSPRYRPAFVVRDDWKKFAERLGPKVSLWDMEHCGYSTNPSYSAEIITLVGRYRLNDPRALQWFATGKDPGRAADSLQLTAHST